MGVVSWYRISLRLASHGTGVLQQAQLESADRANVGDIITQLGPRILTLSDIKIYIYIYDEIQAQRQE